jgi:hypothetical protein
MAATAALQHSSAFSGDSNTAAQQHSSTAAPARATATQQHSNSNSTAATAAVQQLQLQAGGTGDHPTVQVIWKFQTGCTTHPPDPGDPAGHRGRATAHTASPYGPVQDLLIRARRRDHGLSCSAPRAGRRSRAAAVCSAVNILL